MKKVNVKQGYSNCSICKINDSACITSDEGIFKALLKENIDVLLIKTKSIKLLNGENYSKMNGFIGGATCIINNKFIIFGDINNLEEYNKNLVIKFIEKYGMELIDFPGKEIIDYGSVIFT